MKKFIFALVVFASISMSSIVMAQRPGGTGEGGQRGGARGGGEGGQRGSRGGGRGFGGGQRGGERAISPLMTALDADKDGKLSAEEIKNAATALASLDKNKDGILEVAELAPARPERGGRGGGSGGPGGFDPSAMVDRIMARDADKDEKLSKEEAGDRMARVFDGADTDKDGFLTRKEVEDMTKQWGGGSRGGRGGGGRGQQPKSKENRPAFDDQ